MINETFIFKKKKIRGGVPGSGGFTAEQSTFKK
jgi:hypothetical protein